MNDGPLFVAAPPLRCQRPRKASSPQLCGEIASWMQPGNDVFMPTYVCDLHRDPSCVSIPSAGVFRRVSVQVEVLFSAASWSKNEAQAEAVARLERIVQAAGGLLSLTTVTSAVG